MDQGRGRGEYLNIVFLISESISAYNLWEVSQLSLKN